MKNKAIFIDINIIRENVNKDAPPLGREVPPGSARS